MAKKSIAEAAQEAAANSRAMNKKYPPPTINVAPKTKPKPQIFGGSMNKAHPKDVNLPAPKTGFGQMSDKDISVISDASRKLNKKK